MVCWDHGHADSQLSKPKLLHIITIQSSSEKHGACSVDNPSSFTETAAGQRSLWRQKDCKEIERTSAAAMNSVDAMLYYNTVESIHIFHPIQSMLSSQPVMCPAELPVSSLIPFMKALIRVSSQACALRHLTRLVLEELIS